MIERHNTRNSCKVPTHKKYHWLNFAFESSVLPLINIWHFIWPLCPPPSKYGNVSSSLGHGLFAHSHSLLQYCSGDSYRVFGFPLLLQLTLTAAASSKLAVLVLTRIVMPSTFFEFLHKFQTTMQASIDIVLPPNNLVFLFAYRHRI